MIKAIETAYKGYNFRSRLEARWAVFFDTLGIEWEYEFEGYDLGEEGYYLPDFWLPQIDCWIEVKPLPIGRDHKICSQLRAFNYAVGPIICLQGVPTIDEYEGHLFCGDVCDSGGGVYESDCKIFWCSDCNKTSVAVSDSRLERDRVLYRSGGLVDSWPHYCDHGIEVITLTLAVQAARSARFEHGAKGY